MDMHAFRLRLLELAEQLTGDSLGEDSLQTSVAELGLDSLMALELAVYLEREFRFRMSEDEIGSLNCLNDIILLAQTRESL